MANKAKSDFLANMNHELRTPLNAILGFAQILLKDKYLSQKQREHLIIINRSGDHLLSLINQVLHLSAIEAGKIKLDKSTFGIYNLIIDLRGMFSLKFKDKNLDLIMDIDKNLPRYITTDEIKLKQVLINLINNAYKFTSSGHVKVCINPLRKDSKSSLLEINFKIIDTGCGIAKDEMKLLFKAFSQTSSGKTSKEGTGLGLVITSNFIKLMGGDIRLESELDKGTIVEFNIKAEIASVIDSSQKEKFKKVLGLKPGQPKYRILIVDDKEDNRLLLFELMAPLGFELREAINGKEAVEIFKEFKPNLICMDLKMSIMDGYTATKLIREIDQDKNTKIIALTASTYVEEKSQILDIGCDEVLNKPFKEFEIFEALHKLIGVEYIYDEFDDSELTKPVTKIEGDEFNLESVLKEVPEELLHNLLKATELSQADIIDEYIEEINQYNNQFSEMLKEFANEFNHDKILEILENRGK